MIVGFEDLLRAWDGQQASVRYDASIDAWMIVAVHSTALGPAMGGTRLKVYQDAQDAMRDVLRLASAMTLKQAAAGLPFGGGKAVIAPTSIPPAGSGQRRDLMLRYGDLVASLGGTYVTACDMNTGPQDMDVIAERTPHVLGRSPANGGSGDSGADTAIGVFHGVRASVDRAFGSDELEGRSVLVQGLGSVGGPVSELLAEAGASLLVSDLDAERVAVAVQRHDAVAIPPEAVIGTPCDVFVPCATGGILNADTIPRLRCRVVAGAANNQLATSEDAEGLRAAGILYAPDFVVNAGGVLHLAGYETLGWDEATMARNIAAIADTLSLVFDAADRDGSTTYAAAERIARERIAVGVVVSPPDS
jgi:leucine dehydrogenase